MPILFQFQKKTHIKGSRKLISFIRTIFGNESKQVQTLSYIFCGDRYLRDLNRKFLNHDYYTDILSFNMNLPENQIISGEIYISVDRVLENAQKFGKTFENELYRVIIHGALHLCGYLDGTVLQKKEMTKKEDEYLEMFHVEHLSTRRDNV